MPRIANISPRGIRRRAFGSLPMLLVAVALGAFMVLEDWDRGFRTVLVLPLWLSLLGLFQAHEKTWIVHAARGTRELDHGEEKIHDDDVIARIRRQSGWVLFESAFGAILLVVLFWLFVP